MKNGDFIKEYINMKSGDRHNNIPCRVCLSKLKRFKNTKRYERYKCVNKNCKAYNGYIYLLIKRFEFPKSHIKKDIEKLTIPKSLKLKMVQYEDTEL